MSKQYMPVSELTPDNYYSALRCVQNSNANIDRDIVTFTAFLDWNEKLTHYSRYLGYALGKE